MKRTMRNKKTLTAAMMAATLAFAAATALSPAVMARAESTGAQYMHRLYNPNTGEHFYTGSVNEAATLEGVGWSREGIGWIAPVSSDTPVYRLYNSIAGVHHFTTSLSEKTMLVSLGWNDEGIGWYSDDAKGVPVYRGYNKNNGQHLFTANQSEHSYLVASGWQGEGIGWYGIDENAATKPDDKDKTDDKKDDETGKTDNTQTAYIAFFTGEYKSVSPDRESSLKIYSDGTFKSTLTGYGTYTCIATGNVATDSQTKATLTASDGTVFELESILTGHRLVVKTTTNAYLPEGNVYVFTRENSYGIDYDDSYGKINDYEGIFTAIGTNYPSTLSITKNGTFVLHPSTSTGKQIVGSCEPARNGSLELTAKDPNNNDIAFSLSRMSNGNLKLLVKTSSYAPLLRGTIVNFK